MPTVLYRRTSKRIFTVRGSGPNARFDLTAGGHGYMLAASRLHLVHKTLPSRPVKFWELYLGRKAHTLSGKARKVPQPCRRQNSFIAAKFSEPIRFSCNPGVPLLLPPSLVRAGALRSIFIHLVPA